MSLVFDVLHVAGNAVGLVLRDDNPIRCGLGASIVTPPTRRSRRFAIDGIESLMAT